MVAKFFLNGSNFCCLVREKYFPRRGAKKETTALRSFAAGKRMLCRRLFDALPSAI